MEIASSNGGVYVAVRTHPCAVGSKLRSDIETGAEFGVLAILGWEEVDVNTDNDDRNDYVHDTDLPDEYINLDKRAIASKTLFAWLSGLQLFLFFAASILSIATWQYHGLIISFAIASVALVAALLIQAYLSVGRPQERWRKARLGAEGIKSCAWRYMMSAPPFVSVDNEAADHVDDRFKELVTRLFAEAGGSVRNSGAFVSISPTMQNVRAMSVQRRIKIYNLSRMGEQLVWFETKTKRLGRSVSNLNRLLTALQVIAILALLARAFGVFGFDLFAVVSAVGAMYSTFMLIDEREKNRDAYDGQVRRIQLVRNDSLIRGEMSMNDLGLVVADNEEILTGLPTALLRLGGL